MNDTIKPDLNKWYEPYTSWKIPTKNWAKLNEKYSFDLDLMRSNIIDIMQNYELKPFPSFAAGRWGHNEKTRFDYNGIGLTCREDATDPLYDALNTFNRREVKDKKYTENGIVNTLTYERNFTQRTDACTPYLSEILDRFSSTMCKARILELKPGGIIFPHVDFPYYEQVRLHAPIFSNEETFWEVNGERFQIPEDGNFYWFDTGKYHSVVNKGTNPRIMLSVNLSIYKDRNDNLINTEENIDEIIISDKI